MSFNTMSFYAIILHYFAYKSTGLTCMFVTDFVIDRLFFKIAFFLITLAVILALLSASDSSHPFM